MPRRKDTPIAAVVAFTSTSDGSDAPALDLNEYIVKNPNSTFYLKVEGNGWESEGIYSGDVLAIDRSLDPKPNSTVVAVQEGELVLTKLKKGSKLELWGVVSSVVRKL